MPLLAVDRAGHRLGYGRGWYDRTLAALRAGEGVVVRSVSAMACSGSTGVPSAAGDQPVDWILTERAIERVRW